MSESGNRNDAPADRQTSSEKLVQELKDMKAYEPGMAVKEMSDLLKVLKDSMPKQGSQNSITDEMPEVRQPVRQPSNFQVGNANSSMSTQRRSSSPDPSSNQHNSYVSRGNGAESPEEAKNTGLGRNSFEKNRGKEFKDASTNANNARNAINENTIEPTNENRRANTRMNSQAKSEDRIFKWKINPLDHNQNDRDKPLTSRFHGSSDRDNTGVRTLANINKDIERMSLHLLKVSDACRNQRWRNDHSNVTWGTGIKVGTANGSLDIEAFADDATEVAEEPPDEPGQGVVGETMNSRRRKACVRKVDPKAYIGIDDNNSEDEFETPQKKRKGTKPDEPSADSHSSKDTNLNMISENSKKPKFPVRDDEYHWGVEFFASSDEESAEKRTKRKRAKTSHAKSPTLPQSGSKTMSVELVSTDESKDDSVENEAADQIFVDDSDEVTICEGATAGESRSDTTEATSSVYPRRIVPPNPRRKFIGLRSRKPLQPNASRANKRDKRDDENDAEVARTLSKGRGKARLQDDEIVEELENDGEDIVETSLVYSPSIVPLRPSSRLRLQAERLRAERQKECEAELLKREVERIREEKNSQRKIERVRQRIQEESEIVKLEEQNEKRKSAGELSWRERMRLKEKQRPTERIELNPEGPRHGSDVPSLEIVPENHFGMGQKDVEVIDDNRRGGHSRPEQLTCPICSKDFPVGEIENHAASCEAYDAGSSAGRSRSNSPVIPMSLRNSKQPDDISKLWTCDTCSRFSTRNGKDFEAHVHSCLERLRNGVDVGAGSIVQVPDSPIRTVRKSSEQTDSEIKYAGQLHVPKTRSHVNAAGKRRRR